MSASGDTRSMKPARLSKEKYSHCVTLKMHVNHHIHTYALLPIGEVVPTGACYVEFMNGADDV